MSHTPVPPCSLETLNQQFAIDKAVCFEAGPSGQTRVVVDTPLAQAHVYLLGGHVTHYQPVGHQPVLFVSSQSVFQEGAGIRGGVPVCFPWFSVNTKQPDLPNHGLVRTCLWRVEATILQTDGSIQIVLYTQSDKATKQLWPFDFQMRHIITVGSTLTMALEVVNTDDKPMTFEQALHTYFAVSDVRQVTLRGLENEPYLSKVQGYKPMTQGDQPMAFAGETDFVFTQASGTCVIDDPGMQRQIAIQKTASQSTVVWNPWSDRAKQMADMGDDDWPKMLCVETCNVGDKSVTLEPGATHTMTAIIAARQSS